MYCRYGVTRDIISQSTSLKTLSLFFSLSVHLCLCLSVYLCLSVCLSFSLSVCLFAELFSQQGQNRALSDTTCGMLKYGKNLKGTIYKINRECGEGGSESHRLNRCMNWRHLNYLATGQFFYSWVLWVSMETRAVVCM